MTRTFKFAVLRAVPDARKGETINVGIVVFHPDTIDVRLAPSLNKLLALDGAVDINQVRELPTALGQWTSRFESVEEKFDAIKHFGLITVSELGSINVLAHENYEDVLSRLLRLFVLPRPKETAPLAQTSRITTSLRSIFERQDVLGHSVEDIKNHRIVPNFPIDEDENLYADFALKNGAYWITETADFRAKSKGQLENMRIAGLASIKLNMAKRRFRNVKVNTFVVYAAQSDSDVQGQLNLMSEYADELINLQSKKEVARYTDTMLRFAGPNRQVS